MSHYKSNIRDIEFNLFEVLGRDEVLGRGPFADIDPETARSILAEVDRILARTLAAGGLIGLVLVALQWPLAQVAFAISGASETVVAGLAVYFHIRILSAPFVLANYGVLGSVLGRGRTDLGLLLQVAINLANIGLTLVLVLGFGLGLEMKSETRN